MKQFLFFGLAFLALQNAFALSTGQRFKKVIFIVFENVDFEKTLQQPDFAALVQKGALLNHLSAEVHPSQGNYIALIAGDTLGVRNDNPVDLSQNHVGDLLENAGLDWKVYAENYPGNCFTGATSGRYVRKHNPFISFLNVSTNKNRCDKIIPADSFNSDLQNGSLPSYSFYVPNLDNDGHDTGVEYAGRWLTQAFGNVFSDPDALKDLLFVITFDESKSKAPNQVFTLLIGGAIIPGSQNQQALSHESLLKMVEDEYSLGNLGLKDSQAPAIESIWK